MLAFLSFICSVIKMLSIALIVFWLGEELLLIIHTGWTFSVAFLGTAIFGFLLGLGNNNNTIERRLETKYESINYDAVELASSIVSVIVTWVAYVVTWLLYILGK